MNKQEFKTFCKNEFFKRGFLKYKNGYYLKGPADILCGIFLQKSDFGNYYYINYCFHIQNPSDTSIPSYYDMDMDGGRISVLSKTETDKNGNYFMTEQIEHEEYTEDEMKPFFDKVFEERIFPPINFGKKFILDNLGKLYFLTIHPDEVLKKLQEKST